MTDVPPPPPPPPGPPSDSVPPLPGPPGNPELGKRRSIGMIILLTIITCSIWFLIWSYQNGDELKRWSKQGIGGVGYLIITLLLHPATMFLMAGEVEELYRREGKEPPITTIWGLWFLLPIVGNIIWYVRIQNAINDYWTAHGQTNDPGV